MPTNTWVVLLRNITLEVPDFKVFAHNLTREAANAIADEIYKQRVEGERVTRVYTMDGLEVHENSDPEECDSCHDLIVEARRLELAELEKEMRKRGLK